jgi:crotonobetainyl-CoA:carnitine CoA-transferase CaiB-like acyl-CoA transferase
MAATTFPATNSDAEKPLTGLRVIEVSNGKTDGTGRFLADLGADVILVEPPEGAPGRRMAPLHGGHSLNFAARNANKRSIVLDLNKGEDRQRLHTLLAGARLYIDGTPAGQHLPGLAPEAIAQAHPHLVTLASTDFGLTGPYAGYRASHAVHAAMSGVLCRSGLPGQTPLLPPAKLCWEAASQQAAFAVMLALWQQHTRGHGDILDFSIQEAIAQILDPGLGITGSAAAGQSALDSTPHGRPAPNPMYPIFATADGHVRICTLNPRQWLALSEWMGDDHPYTDPSYASLAKRTPDAPKINEYIARLFANAESEDLLGEARRRGVPMAIVAMPGQVLSSSHFEARGSFADMDMPTGETGRIPSGLLEINGKRAGFRSPAPALGAHIDQVLAETTATLPSAGPVDPGRRPLEGLRVLDLGVIVAGAETGRLLADYGAEVIKIESSAYPDGGRQSRDGSSMTPSIVAGHRNKYSLGLNLRTEAGLALFAELVTVSDVVLTNFKPGTLASLGIDYPHLSQINPAIVLVDNSAFGNSGPLSKSLGYGPLVRSSTGLSSVWSYPEIEDSYSDGVTIYPDHAAARVALTGVLALLLRREATGHGGQVSVAQAEVYLNSVAEEFLHESLTPGSFHAVGNTSEYAAPEGVYPCAGEDEWCVVSVDYDRDWPRLAHAIGRDDLARDPELAALPGRIARRSELDIAVAAWTATLTPIQVRDRLQDLGLAAGNMLRLSQYREDPHFDARKFVRTVKHPDLAGALPAENWITASWHMPAPALRPAPRAAQDTVEIASRVLGRTQAQIDELVAAGDLEVATSAATAHQ